MIVPDLSPLKPHSDTDRRRGCNGNDYRRLVTRFSAEVRDKTVYEGMGVNIV
jgi:hypothetical protein